jgi:hypothetical protein
MKTNSDGQNADLATSRERLKRIRAEQARLQEGAPARSASVRDLVDAVKAAKLNALIDPTHATKAQATKAQVALDEAVQTRDEADESEQILAVEEEAVSAEIARLEGAAEIARVEALKVKLRERIASNAPGFRAYCRDVVALKGLGGTWLFVENLPGVAFAACGAAERELLTAGKDLALGILAGKEDLR